MCQCQNIKLQVLLHKKQKIKVAGLKASLYFDSKKGNKSIRHIRIHQAKLSQLRLLLLRVHVRTARMYFNPTFLFTRAFLHRHVYEYTPYPRATLSDSGPLAVRHESDQDCQAHEHHFHVSLSCQGTGQGQGSGLHKPRGAIGTCKSRSPRGWLTSSMKG